MEGPAVARSANEQLELIRSLQLTALGTCALLATCALVTLGINAWQPHMAATWRPHSGAAMDPA